MTGEALGGGGPEPAPLLRPISSSNLLLQRHPKARQGIESIDFQASVRYAYAETHQGRGRLAIRPMITMSNPCDLRREGLAARWQPGDLILSQQASVAKRLEAEGIACWNAVPRENDPSFLLRVV
jgi:hypothetical protein